MHLRRVAIRGYRSIERGDLRLGQITVVIGPSDSGKSNLIRALRDWAFNASGTAFTTQGCTAARVAVAVGPHMKVVFEKSERATSGRTRYVVVNGETHEKVAYEKVGLTVPHEVVAITQIMPVEVDDLSVRINFAEQDDPWFLLNPSTWTPGKVSKVIGKISGVDALILGNRDLVSARVAKEREAKAARGEADTHRGQLGRYDTLDAEAAVLDEAEAKHAALLKKQRALQEATTLLRRVVERKAQLPRVRERVKLLTAVKTGIKAEKLMEKLDRLAQAQLGLARVEELRARQSQHHAKVARLREQLGSLGKRLAALAKADDLLCPLCGGTAHEGCRASLGAQGEAAAKRAR